MTYRVSIGHVKLVTWCPWRPGQPVLSIFSCFQLKKTKCFWDLEGSRHRQLPSSINPEVKRNPYTPIMYGFKLKKTKWPCDLQGPLEGPRGAGHRQGPSGVDPKVKRNHLNQKIFCSLCSLGDLLEAKMKAAIWWKLKVCTKTLNWNTWARPWSIL